MEANQSLEVVELSKLILMFLTSLSANTGSDFSGVWKIYFCKSHK